MTELKPCPFCGSTRLHVETHVDAAAWVSCDVCWIDGPNGTNAAGARDVWNTRAQPDAPDNLFSSSPRPVSVWRGEYTGVDCVHCGRNRVVLCADGVERCEKCERSQSDPLAMFDAWIHRSALACQTVDAGDLFGDWFDCRGSYISYDEDPCVEVVVIVRAKG